MTTETTLLPVDIIYQIIRASVAQKIVNGDDITPDDWVLFARAIEQAVLQSLMPTPLLPNYPGWPVWFTVDAKGNTKAHKNKADAIDDAKLRDSVFPDFSPHTAMPLMPALPAPEVQALRKDAERYRWMRDPCSGAERVVHYSRGDFGKGLQSGLALDAAIDAAMEQQHD